MFYEKLLSSRKEILEKAVSELLTSTGFSALVATELEFYLDGDSAAKKASELLALILLGCKKEGLSIESLHEEDGENQYEISIVPVAPIEAASNADALKNIIAKSAEALEIKAIFEPSPYEEEPPSGLHIHLSLHDKNGKNVFCKSDDAESTIMLQAIGGLCETMRESMIFFAPQQNSYERFSNKNNQNVSRYVCWGGNNRTAAIRLPTSTLFPNNRHIEHRVSGSDADPFLAITAITRGVTHGINNKISPPKRLYGNSFDSQYSLDPLPTSLKEAENTLHSLSALGL